MPNDHHVRSLHPAAAEGWQGILYCERGPRGNSWSELTREWSDSYLIVGPFLLYGDRELLGRVGAALTARPVGSRSISPAFQGELFHFSSLEFQHR